MGLSLKRVVLFTQTGARETQEAAFAHVTKGAAYLNPSGRIL
jgi:hypothetical protein